MLTANLSTTKTTASGQSLLVRPPGGAGLVRVAPGRADLAKLIQTGALAVPAEVASPIAQAHQGTAKGPSGPAKTRTTKQEALTRAESLQARVRVMLAKVTAAERAAT